MKSRLAALASRSLPAGNQFTPPRAPPGRPAGARSQLAGHSQQAPGGQLGRRSTRPPARFLSDRPGHFRLASWAAANRAKVGPFRRASGRPACLGANSGLAGRRPAGRGLSAAGQRRPIDQNRSLEIMKSAPMVRRHWWAATRTPAALSLAASRPTRRALSVLFVCSPLACRSLATRLLLACHSPPIDSTQSSSTQSKSTQSRLVQKWLGTS